jgi:diguanylate cyclase (GGDEF)-like protein
MRERSTTSYAGLLRRLLEEGYFAPPEIERVEKLLKEANGERVALGTHEFVRRLLRIERLSLRQGDPKHPLEGLTVADERRGLLFVLPALTAPEAGVCFPPLDVDFGPSADFSRDEALALFERLSRQALSSVDRAADLRTAVIGVLDALREFLDVPTALFFSADLPVAGGLARGPRQPVFGRQGSRAGGSGASPAPLPKAWARWARRALEEQDGRACYLTDFAELPPGQRPAERGSALLLRIEVADRRREAVLVAVTPEAHWFDADRLARVRVLAAHFRRLLDHALRLQASIAFDSLTEIYNRVFFEDHFRRTLAGASRRNQGFALLIVDIDDFKGFNQRFGYDAGDEVLRQVARTLKSGLRATDVLARYGGEEFAVLLMPELSTERAAIIGERLRATIERLEVRVPTVYGATQTVRVTVSIGAAFFPRDGGDRDALWNHANRMLLEAKAAGKNCLHCTWTLAGPAAGGALPD